MILGGVSMHSTMPMTYIVSDVKYVCVYMGARCMGPCDPMPMYEYSVCWVLISVYLMMVYMMMIPSYG